MSNELTFNEIPSAIAELNRKMDVLLAEYSSKPPEDRDYLMDVTDLRAFLPEQPARQTVYEWVFKRKIPFEKYGKKLYFRKSAIDIWLTNARRVK
jgi:excisionase family DNA binding protein